MHVIEWKTDQGINSLLKVSCMNFAIVLEVIKLLFEELCQQYLNSLLV